MTVDRILNMFAGLVIMFSVLLAHMAGTFDLTQISWLWLTLFVGFNLFQFSFTGFCPLVTILKKLGVKDRADGGCASGSCGQ